MCVLIWMLSFSSAVWLCTEHGAQRQCCSVHLRTAHDTCSPLLEIVQICTALLPCRTAAIPQGHAGAIDIFRRLQPRLPPTTQLHLIGNLMPGHKAYLNDLKQVGGAQGQRMAGWVRCWRRGLLSGK